jgi:putative endonuclease
MWFVYLIRCSNNSLYCGITNNIEKRFKTHLKGKGARYTRIYPPLRIEYYEELNSKSEALKKEYKIKKFSKIQKETLIKRFLHENNHDTFSTK